MEVFSGRSRFRAEDAAALGRDKARVSGLPDEGAGLEAAAAQVRFLTEIGDDFRRFVDGIWLS